jgi:hypothetical protein
MATFLKIEPAPLRSALTRIPLAERYRPRFTKAEALEGRRQEAEGRRLVALLPFKLVGFNAPCKQSLLVFD